MKAKILTLILSLIAMNNLTGQEKEIRKLYTVLESKGIISSVEKEKLSSKDLSTITKEKMNSFILTELAFLQTPNILHLIKTDSLSNKDGQGITSQISKELIDLGLLSKSLFSEWEKISKGKIGRDNKQAMLMFYAFKVKELEEKPAKRRGLVQLIDLYIKEDLLPENFQSVYEEKGNSIEHPIELFDYTPQGKVLRLANFPVDISQGYKKIYQTLDDLIEGVNIQLQEIKVSPYPSPNPQKAVAQIALQINNEIYRDTFNYNYIGQNFPLEKIMVTSFNSKMINAVNEGLRKNDSVYRLYYINSYDIGYGTKNIAVAYLSKKQYQLVLNNRKSINVYGPNPSRHLSPSIVKNIIQEAKALHLLPANLDTNGKEFIVKTFSDIFNLFKLTYIVPFRVNESENYSDILNGYSKVIGQELSLRPIKEVWDMDNHKVYLSLTVKDQEEKMELKIDGIKIDPFFSSRLRSIIQSSNLSKQLVYLGIEGNNLGIGYFTSQQLDWLKNNEKELWIANH